jgi:hypothetical protein
VLYLYRHAIELGLKDIYAEFRYLLELHGQQRPDFDNNHGLGKIVDDSRELFGNALSFWPNSTIEGPFLSPKAEEFIRQLDQVDPGGEAFRYPFSNPRRQPDGSTRRMPLIKREETVIGVNELRDGMRYLREEIQRVRLTVGVYSAWVRNLPEIDDV